MKTEMTLEDLNYWSKWRPSSGHPKGWRVTRGFPATEELNGKSGRRLIFKSKSSAKKRADKLNK